MWYNNVVFIYKALVSKWDKYAKWIYGPCSQASDADYLYLFLFFYGFKRGHILHLTEISGRLVSWNFPFSSDFYIWNPLFLWKHGPQFLKHFLSLLLTQIICIYMYIYICVYIHIYIYNPKLSVTVPHTCVFVIHDTSEHGQSGIHQLPVICNMNNHMHIYWDQNKMAHMLQTTLSNEFVKWKILHFELNFIMKVCSQGLNTQKGIIGPGDPFAIVLGLGHETMICAACLSIFLYVILVLQLLTSRDVSACFCSWAFF